MTLRIDQRRPSADLTARRRHAESEQANREGGETIEREGGKVRECGDGNWEVSGI